MRLAGCVTWFVLAGWALALIWFLGGVVFALSVIGLPLARSAMEMTQLSAWPFGRDVVHIRDLDQKQRNRLTATSGTIGLVANLIWAASFGSLLFIAYLLAGIVSCLTIIGIPFGIQAFKLAGVSFWPVGWRVVSVELAEIVRTRKARDQLAGYATAM
ncbi:MAG: YccF family protein [Paracoccaceae bacterium]